MINSVMEGGGYNFMSVSEISNPQLSLGSTTPLRVTVQ